MPGVIPNSTFKFLMAFWSLATVLIFSSCGSVSDGSSSKAAAGVRVTPDTTTFSEKDGSGSFTVALDTKPDAAVVIAVASSDTTEATVDKDELTFTPENWSTPQVVTVKGVNDPVADGNQTFDIVMEINTGDTKDPNYRNLSASAVPNVSVTVTDNDVAGVTVVIDPDDSNKKTITFSESEFDSFYVNLRTKPDGDVVIAVASPETTEATVDKDELTFTPENWSTYQKVKVLGVDDSIPDGNQTFDISVDINAVDTTDTTGYADLAPFAVDDVEVTVIDDDEAGVTVTPEILIFSESGSGSFTVRLNTKPDDDVVIDVASSDTAEVAVSKETLTFTPEDWSTAQTVTISGVDDLVADGNQNVTINVNVDDDATFDTTGYKSLAVDDVADVKVTVIDNDEVGVTVTPKTIIFSESGSDSFTVRLNTKPDDDVVIDVASSDTTEATVDKATLTFTPEDWSTAQTVTISGVDDLVADGNQNVVINVNVDDDATFDTTGYKSLAVDDVEVTVIDDDVP